MFNRNPSKGKIIVFGFLFSYPLAGVIYQFLHYLIGLRRLGYDPYYVEDSTRWSYNLRLNDLVVDATENIKSTAPVLEQYGFGDRWVYRGQYEGGDCYGIAEAQLLQLYRDADAFLNVTGAQEIREEHLNCPRRIYVESDPVFSQVLVHQNDPVRLAELAAHDTFFSFGENLGAPDCKVPIERFVWQPTRQPVVLDLWHTPFNAREKPYRTITTWSNTAKDITYDGETYYWTKDREFMKFIDLPNQTSVPFELAVAGTGVTEERLNLLHKQGWCPVDGLEISQDIHRYRRFIHESRGEFTIARDQYVRLNTGWFSDRSVCYLAAGRPVITQETGFSKFLPTGKGLFSFKNTDDVLAALDAIESDYEGNCRAASEIAAEYFDAEKVIGSLMGRAGL